MTREDRAAEVVYGPRSAAVTTFIPPESASLLYQVVADAIREAEANAVAAERESCARICDGSSDIPEGVVWVEGMEHCEFLAAAIRARGTPPTEHPDAARNRVVMDLLAEVYQGLDRAELEAMVEGRMKGT